MDLGIIQEVIEGNNFIYTTKKKQIIL